MDKDFISPDLKQKIDLSFDTRMGQLSKAVKNMRDGHSVEWLAYRCGLSTRHLHSIEAGNFKNGPTIKTITILEIIGISEGMIDKDIIIINKF